MDKIKISKSLESQINHLLEYYGGVKNNVLVIHAKEGWNEKYREVNDLDSITLAQILLGEYEVEITEKDLDKTFRFLITANDTEYLAMRLGERYAVAWVEDNKPMMSHHSIEAVINFLSRKAWRVI